MQFSSFFVARHDTGALLPNARVYVYLVGTTTLASLFDGSGASVSNPFIADATALAAFEAPDGVYDLKFVSSDTSYTSPILQKHQIHDLSQLPVAAVADSVATTVAGIVADHNALLASLRSAKIIATSGGGGGGGLTAQPALSDLAFHFKADAITPQTDNTTLATWTDSVAGISMVDALSNGFTVTNHALYRTSRTNSKPAVQFAGQAAMKLGRPTQLLTALGRGSTSTGVTLFFVMANVGGPTLNFSNLTTPQFFGTETAGNGKHMVINNDGAGGHVCGPAAWSRFTIPTTGLQVIVIRCDTVTTNNGLGHFFQNGNAINGADVSAHASENYMIGGANNTTGGLGPYNSLTGDMMEFGCYNRSLSFAEILQLTKWAFDKYGAAYPWAGASNFLVGLGDSIMFGYLSGQSDSPPRNYTDNSWFQQLMLLKGRNAGTYSNFAVTGRTSAQIASALSALDLPGAQTQLGSVPLKFMFNEYYNQPDADAHGALSVTTALKALSSSFKIGTLDAISTGDQEANRSAFNTAEAGDTHTDVKVPVHTEATVGVTWPGVGTYYADNAHPTTAGQQKIRDFVSSYYDTLNAL